MKIYTKTGDGGKTALFGGTRVHKSDLRIDAYGTLDELNSYIGLLRDQASLSSPQHQQLLDIQAELFTIGSYLATEPAKAHKLQLPPLPHHALQRLEQAIDDIDQQVPPLKNFILPGGHTTVSFCHIARCVCRRAERLTVALAQVAPVDDFMVQYLNRLSDYLFMLARQLAVQLQAPEIAWQP